MTLDTILSNWSATRLAFFLKLRNIEVPIGSTRQELIDLVKSKSDVPIISVEITPYILENLTHQQLINYLLERGYAIISKSNMRPFTSDETSRQLVKEVLSFALKDYEENVSLNPSKYNYIIPKVLLKEEEKSIKLFDSKIELSYDQIAYYYKELHLDFILQNFGADKTLNHLTVESKLEFANKSIQYLVSGSA